eukprot:CAMPEP_0117736630 /NCGR_PEP_ID=MMETSP0947-20121206/2048_1 /TAXON_ID=44440 /ORGANISM="Chattonella subsalsa, Strain CCMP2191" /LENGTH=473 /DNA_ID=CAMNT_0005551965 /DNA_START=688 /DNA_END=2109 /DNA_ORIENTATION=-
MGRSSESKKRPASQVSQVGKPFDGSATVREDLSSNIPKKLATDSPQIMTLKVEHALEYLEKVKATFKDRPGVYEEFTRIMGGFEKRVMDTPGVISRVSKLFSGHENLITGFNNFLPDHFKTDGKGQNTGDRVPLPPSQHMSLRVLRVEDALDYVELVRQEFKDDQAIFSEFQDTIRNYGLCKLDTKSVVKKCLQMFDGHEKLILGLNNFLPPELALALPGEKKPSTSQGSTVVPGQPMVKQENPPTKRARRAKPKPKPKPKGASSVGPLPLPPAVSSSTEPTSSGPSEVSGGSGAQAEKQPARGQKIEIDHAISYITTVKQRFVNEPERYQQFLEILRSYQTNRGNMKDVLQQLSILFNGHDDLLDQFSSFLLAGTAPQENPKGNTPRPRPRKERANMPPVNISSIDQTGTHADVSSSSLQDSSTSFGSSGGADSDEAAETNSLDSDESNESAESNPCKTSSSVSVMNVADKT